MRYVTVFRMGRKSIIAFLTVFGLLFTSVGVHMYLSDRELIKEGMKTTATVVDVQFYKGAYMPIIEYTPENFRPILKPLGSASNPPSYQSGDVIEIYYDRESPEEFAYDSFFSTIFHLIFVFVGVIVLCIDIVIIVKQNILGNR